MKAAKTAEYLTDFYSRYDEERRLLLKHGTVEFLTTMRYIEKYIKPGDRVLEIGAGTGRYSHALAHRGYRVDAVELVDHNIEIFRSHITPDENVSITRGNALDLSMFPDDQYDINTLHGPHQSVQNADKRQAVGGTLHKNRRHHFCRICDF